MLIEMFRRNPELSGGRLDGRAGEVIHDMSVGYDLAGVRSDKVRRFLDGMRDASRMIERLRSDIPREWAEARDAAYPTRLSDSVTLSTFHGCPVDEIASICEFLIAEHDVDVIVKMNPPTLGRERLEYLLYDVMGYHELRVNPTCYAAVATMDESVRLCEHLTDFGAARRRRVGFKFSNTLEVLNHRDFFTAENKIMYLSGQPLHVITMTLTDEFRRRVGPHVPISFSAGIDQHNFPLAVACGFVPITASTDLLRPGGYGRLPKFVQRLSEDMKRCGAATIDEYVLTRFGQADEARRRAVEELGPGATAEALRDASVAWAGWLNTSLATRLAQEDTRYRADHTGKVPRRIDSHLELFDCITCDKCLPVCPNAANFTYPTPLTSFEVTDLVVSPDGTWRPGATRLLAIDQSMQIACYADFCNECGNCDTFCPEYGGPYIKKPSFFGSVESWRLAAPRDGFVVEQDRDRRTIHARIRGATFGLMLDRSRDVCEYIDGLVEAAISTRDHKIESVRLLDTLRADHVLDMWIYHVLRTLLEGVLDRSRINQVNVGIATS